MTRGIGCFAGVVLVQSLQLTGFFQYGVRLAAETENYFTSVERIQVPFVIFGHLQHKRDHFISKALNLSPRMYSISFVAVS